MCMTLSAAQCKVEVAQEESDGKINNLSRSVLNASRGRRETQHLNIRINVSRNEAQRVPTTQ